MRSAHSLTLDADEMKMLIYARATGAVDNSACRDFSGLDALAASRVRRRLRDRGLLDRAGAGSSTYYLLARPQTTPQAPLAQLALGTEQGGIGAIHPSWLRRSPQHRHARCCSLQP